MKKILAIALCSIATLSYAQDNSYYDRAQVLNVEPIVKTSYNVIPRTFCSEPHYSANTNGAGAVTGAIIGGVIGHSVGKDAGAALGAITGSMIGGSQNSRVQGGCYNQYDRQAYNVVTGFNVTIQYENEIRTVRMNRDPGNTVNVKIVKRVYVVE